MQRGPSPANTVTASMPDPTPNWPASVPYGESMSFSAKQNDSLPGAPCVARSTPPGRPPPTFRTTSWSARPIVELARFPWPRAFTPEFIPILRVPGPLQTTTGPTGMVVASNPCMLNWSVQTASTAVSTHGRYSGRQPAMTAAIATFSTVTATRSGGTVATISSGVRLVPLSIRNTRCSDGGTTGRPSVHPRVNIISMSSSSSATSIRRDRNPLPPCRTRNWSTRSGSTLFDPHPGRYAGRSGPSPEMPVSVSQSVRSQPIVRSTSTPSTTLITVGTV